MLTLVAVRVPRPLASSHDRQCALGRGGHAWGYVLMGSEYWGGVMMGSTSTTTK